MSFEFTEEHIEFFSKTSDEFVSSHDKKDLLEKTMAGTIAEEHFKFLCEAMFQQESKTIRIDMGRALMFLGFKHVITQLVKSVQEGMRSIS